MIIRYLTIFFFVAVSASAQVIDNTSVFRQIASSQYIRLHYENDFFSKADIYYTQGINLEVVHPALKSNPLASLLIHSQKKENKYGISIEHLGFTPTSISHDEILIGDRPFASCLFM